MQTKNIKEVALITGASAGIGLAIARELAKKNIDVVLVARRIEKLEALKAELEKAYPIKAYVIACDLSKLENIYNLHAETMRQKLNISVLINNAGFGLYGNFDETPLAKELEMIQTNLSAVVALTKLYLPGMKARGHGRIMNLGSLLSFFPFPYYSVYAASKAFILSFSEAIRTELQGTGVTVTAVCPGPTNSEFTSPAMFTTNAYQSLKLSSPEDVAKKGVAAMLQGKMTVFTDLQTTILANTPRFSPRLLTLAINKHMASQAK